MDTVMSSDVLLARWRRYPDKNSGLSRKIYTASGFEGRISAIHARRDNPEKKSGIISSTSYVGLGF